MEIAIILLAVALIFVFKAIKVVPQQTAYVVERLGRYHGTLAPGLNIVVPFIDRLAYRHELKEIPLDVPSQICITRDNTQLQVDGILYFQVTDPKLASYGSSDYILAISQLAQTTLRSVIGKMELDKTFEERASINHTVVAALDEAAANWGVKVLRYEIKDLTPPKPRCRTRNVTALWFMSMRQPLGGSGGCGGPPGPCWAAAVPRAAGMSRTASASERSERFMRQTPV